MYLKKMLLLSLLISISILPLYSQNANSENGNGSDLDLADKKIQIENMRIQRINDLLNQNNISEIDTLFNSDEDDFYTLLKDNDKENASFVREMMFKAYRNVPSLQDNLLFLDCKRAAIAQDWDLVSLKANDIVRRYPNSDKKKAAINYWKFALIKLGKDQEFINLVEQFPELDKTIQKFQYGQALYNVGRYDDAQQYLIDAAADPKYAFKATATLALLSFAKGDVVEATQIFDYLEANYPPETPNYEFVILSKARLFSHFGDTKDALLYYRTYGDLLGDSVTADIIYEIALTYRNAGQLEKSKKSFEALLASKIGEEYYIPTLYNLVMIDVEMNEGVASDTLLTNYQIRVDDYFDALVANKNLMNETRSLRNRYIMENDKNSKEILLEQIRNKEEQILSNQKLLENKISFLDPKTAKLIGDIELKLLETTETYFIELDEIEKYRESPKERLIEIANNNRITNEASYVLSISGELLEEIPNPNADQFERAYNYANQIFIKKKLILNYSNLLDKTKNLPEKNRELKELIDSENESLDELKVRAGYELAEFPNLESKQENIDKMVEKFVLDEQKMEVKRKKVIDSYYDIVANKKKKNVIEDFKEVDKNINAYTNSFTKFEKLKEEQHKNIDYIALDLEFRKITKQYNELYAQNANDTTSYDAKFEELNTQRKNLYQKTNNFVFKNNDFENNYKLYFNMAEMAFFIYRDNNKLIYDLYKKVIELNPDFPQKDVIYYKMAVNKQILITNEITIERERLMRTKDFFSKPLPENVKKTPKVYKEVMDNYIQVVKINEDKLRMNSMFRMAQLLFDFAVDGENPEEYVNKAIKIYDNIQQIGNVDEKKRALFFNAWLKITILKYTEALNDLELLMSMKDEFNQEQKNWFKSSEEIIAYALTYMDEEESIKYVTNDLYSKFDKDIAENAFIKLAEKKDDANNYKYLVNLYQARSLIDPYAIYNPTYIDSIITTLGRNYLVIKEDTLNTWNHQIYREAYDRYGYDSEWYQYNKDQDLSPYVGSIQTALEGTIIPERNMAMKENTNLETIQLFSDAVEQYANYKGFNDSLRTQNLKIYDKNANISFRNFVIANPDTTNMRAGIEKVYNYIDRNPNDEERAVLEESAYTWANKITAIIDTTSYDSLLFTQSEIDNRKENARKEYLEIADRFYNYLVSADIDNRDETIQKLLYWRGQRKMDMGDMVGAKNDFLASDSLDVSDDLKVLIYQNLAVIFQNEGDFDTSNEYFTMASKYADPKTKQEFEKAKYINNSDKLKSLREKGDFIAAAEVLENDLNPSEFTPKADKENNEELIIALRSKGGDSQGAIERLLKKADDAKEIDKAWYYYSNAISIAKDSLNNKNQALAIEDKFMTRFPTDRQTFKILHTRLDAVKDSTLSTYDPILASEKYIDIYNRATKKGQELDISALSRTPIEYYVLGIEIKCRVLSKADQVNEWLAFRDKFPDYNTVIVLRRIIALYKELGMDDKYLEYIITLYQFDNTEADYIGYAAEKLSAKDKEILSARRAKNWQVMLGKIEEFNSLSETFTNNGIPAETLFIPRSKEDYARYTVEYERDVERKAFIAEMDNKIENHLNFIDVDPDDLSRLRVNANTNWYGYLAGGQNRLAGLDKRTEDYLSIINQDIVAVTEFDLLSEEDRFSLLFRLYHAEYKISNYVFNIYTNQMEKFIGFEKNREGNLRYIKGLEEQYYDGKISIEQYQQKSGDYINDLNTIPYEYSGKYSRKSVDFLRFLYEGFVDGYTNQRDGAEDIIAGLKLYNMDEQRPVQEMVVPFTSQMRKDFSNITESSYNDGYREFSMYNIPGGETLQIETDVNCPIFPKKYRLSFVAESDFMLKDENVELKVSVNDTPIVLEGSLIFDGEIMDSLSNWTYLRRSLANFNNILTNNFLIGKNKISITIENKKLTNYAIGAIFSIIYDDEEMFNYENQIISTIVTDNSWVATDSLQSLDLADPSWTPVTYGTMLDDYYQLDEFKESLAIPIWFDNIDDAPEFETATNDFLIDSTFVSLAEPDTILTAEISSDSTLILVDSTSVETDTTLVVYEEEELVEEGITYFAKEFEIEGSVTECLVNFLFNNDASAFVIVNGERLEFDWYSGFYPPTANQEYISKDLLQEGKNTIVVAVSGPVKNNGILLEMIIKTIVERR